MNARIAAIVGGALALGLGCSFPEVAYDREPGGAAGAGGSTATAGGGGTGNGGAGNGGTSTAGNGGTSAGSAGTAGTSTMTGSGGAAGAMLSGSGGTGPVNCDEDKDGHLVNNGICGGDDCDDTNPAVYKDEPNYYYMAKDGASNFDYDCDNKSTLDPTLNVGIAACGSHLLQPGCEAAGEGFLNNMIPPCGQAADWGTCKWNGALCMNQKINSTKMACK